MAFISPYITDKYVAYLGEVRSTGLSLAVRIIDDYTGKEPIGNIKVLIKEGNKKAIKNPSGYYLFNDLAGGNYSINIESDLYFPEKRTVDSLRMRTLDSVTLNLDNGPLAEATSTMLTDVSQLKNGDVVEFRNPVDKVEQRGIKYINESNRTIFWKKGLKYDFDTSGSTIHALDYVNEIFLKPLPSYPFPSHATLVRGSVSNEDPVVNAEIDVVGTTIQTRTYERGEFVIYFKGVEDKKEITIEIKKNRDTKTVDETIEEGKTTNIGVISF